MKVADILSWGPKEEIESICSKTRRGLPQPHSWIFIVLRVCLRQQSKAVKKSRMSSVWVEMLAHISVDLSQLRNLCGLRFFIGTMGETREPGS